MSECVDVVCGQAKAYIGVEVGEQILSLWY